VLAGGVVFLLLLVFFNVVNLVLVRSHVHAVDDAVRAAIGCGTLRLVRRRIGESLFLAVAGGGVGVALAWAAIRAFEVLAPRTVPLIDRVQMDGTALLFGFAVVLVAAVVCGLMPAVQTSRLHLSDVLKNDVRLTADRGRRRTMNVLVVSELALAMLLLTAATVMTRTVSRLAETDPGFDAEKVFTFSLNLFGPEVRTVEAWVAFYREVADRLRALPGIEAVGRCSMTPFSERTWSGPYGWDQHILESVSPRADRRVVGHDYFKAMGTRLVAGRDFNDAELTGKTSAAIVDDVLARRAWPGENPMGKRLLIGIGANQFEVAVIGVVEHMQMGGFRAENRDAIYLPEGGYPGRASLFAVRSALGTDALANSVRRVVRSMNPSLVPYDFARLSDLLDRSMAPERFVLAVTGCFAAVALVLAVVGLFGVMAYAVRTRTTEIAIRMALGAEPRTVLRMVLRRGACLALVGIGAGIGAEALLARYLESVVYGVSPTDPLAMLQMGALLGLTALGACYVPARWACHVDPGRALRTS
jgi:putative ABC transport system permease protein